MKRKRFCRICAVCVLALTVLFTAGCSSKKSEEKNTAAAETAVPAAALTEEMEEDKVLLDESGLKITANRMFYDEAYGKGVQLTFENHSGKILIFDCKSIFVNGFAEVEDTFAELLNKDETKQVNVYLDTMELEAYGIDEIGEVGFRFDFYTPQTYEKYLTPDVIGFQTSAYADMPEEMKFAGKVLYEDENVTLRAIYTAKSDDVICGKPYGPGDDAGLSECQRQRQRYRPAHGDPGAGTESHAVAPGAFGEYSGSSRD